MMMNGTSVWIFTFFLTWKVVTSVFFHEQSSVVLSADTNPSAANGSDFGFSLGYFRKKLVVSDPRTSVWGLGAMYSCSLNLTVKPKCTRIPIKVDEKKYSKEIDKQNFFLGGTIAASDDFFITCAPLAVMKLLKNNLTDAYGSCFINNETDSSLHDISIDPVRRYIVGKENKIDLIAGGYGWNSLIDDVHHIVLVAKTSVSGDIDYWKIRNKSILNSEPKTVVRYDSIAKTKFVESWNVGYGLAAGKFFKEKPVVYAVSMQIPNSMRGEIVFLEPTKSGMKLSIVKRQTRYSNNEPYHITHRVVNAMFGYAMAADDFNLDGLAELIVGAPAQSEDGYTVESGALHIYVGGSINECNDLKMMRSIVSDKDYGRFGTSIAVGDIDGDNISEVLVSALYEDQGVVYILSGYDIRELIKLNTYKKQSLSDLKHTQRLEMRALRLYGFSIQVLPDVDGNGHDDIAIGAPGSASVAVLRSFQSINVTISLEVVGGQMVKEEDKDFVVGVCLHFGYNSKSADVNGTIKVVNNITGPGASIGDPNFDVYLSKNIIIYCENITVLLNFPGPGDYKFTTHLEIMQPFNTINFDTSWAVPSPYSDTHKTLDIPRHCNSDDCDPKLSILEVRSTIAGPEYLLGSSEEENVTITVLNEGHAAYEACVHIRTFGARVARLACSKPGKEDYYQCLLPLPLHRNTTYSITMTLDMQKDMSNLDTKLQVDFQMLENCNLKSEYTKASLTRYYSKVLEVTRVILKEVPHEIFVTDGQLLKDDESLIKDTHSYLITNNGTIKWSNVRASIRVEKEAFIEMVETTDPGCVYSENSTIHYEFSCELTLPPNSTKNIAASIHMSKKKLGEILVKPKSIIKTTSEFILQLLPTDEKKHKRIVSEIKLVVDMTFGNNKTLVYVLALFGALLVVLVIAIVLKMYGFFKRNQKKRLDVLRESVRKRSIRQASESKMSQKSSVAAGSGVVTLEDEGEDCVFDEVSTTPPTTDDIMLVESEAQVHVERSI